MGRAATELMRRMEAREMMIVRRYMLVDVVWFGLRRKRWKTEDELKRRRLLTIYGELEFSSPDEMWQIPAS